MSRALTYFQVIFIFFFLLTPALVAPKSYAEYENSSGIAVYLPILEKKVQEGDIVSISKNGYTLSRVPYDPNIFGVVVKDPALAFENNRSGSFPVVSAGKVLMRVSTTNGKIKKGDLLTSSKTPGVGQKATDTGYIVATALGDFNAKSSQKIGKILVVLDVGHGNVSGSTSVNLLQGLNYVLTAPYASPIAVLRYVVSGIIVIVSFILGIGYLGRLSGLGVEALGRNPLAGRMIIMAIVLNVIVALSIILVGIFIGYLVLVV